MASQLDEGLNLFVSMSCIRKEKQGESYSGDSRVLAVSVVKVPFDYLAVLEYTKRMMKQATVLSEHHAASVSEQHITINAK